MGIVAATAQNESNSTGLQVAQEKSLGMTWPISTSEVSASTLLSASLRSASLRGGVVSASNSTDVSAQSCQWVHAEGGNCKSNCADMGWHYYLTCSGSCHCVSEHCTCR